MEIPERDVLVLVTKKKCNNQSLPIKEILKSAWEVRKELGNLLWNLGSTTHKLSDHEQFIYIL